MSLLIVIALAAITVAVLFALSRHEKRAFRRQLERETRELEYAIEREKDNPLRVIGGSRGPVR